MDLDWLRANPRNLGISLHHQRIRETPVPGGDVCAAVRLTLDDTSPGADVTWLEWYRSRRIEPYLRASRDAGALTDGDVAAVEMSLTAIDAPTEPPSRIHGDLH